MAFSNFRKRVVSALKSAYIFSPINFSFITGWRYPGIPRLKGNFLLGRLMTIFKENGPLENVIAAGKLAEKHPSGMCYFWLGPQVAMLLTRPEDIQALKVKYEQHLCRDLPLLRTAVGHSIFTDDRQTWREKRDAYRKIMNHEELEKLEPRIEKIITRYMESLQAFENQPLQMRTFLSNMVIEVVTTNLMGCPAKHDHGDNDQRIKQANELSAFLSDTLQEVLQISNLFKHMLPGIIRKIFFRKSEDFETVKARMQNRYYQLFLTPHRDHILETPNLIKEIWDINHQKNAPPGCPAHDDKEILGDGLFLLIAGIATTVATLEFNIKLLAAHPEKMTKLRAEIQQCFQESDTHLEAIKKMAYLEMVIKETMRLYPPAPLLMPREIDSYIEINGVPLFKGVVPIFAAYVTHRLKDHWEQPEEFIPERFAKENQDKINSNAYFPFSLGPRFCAGQQFALLEMKVVLAELFRRYWVEIENNSFEVNLKQGGMAPAVAPIIYLQKNNYL